MQMHSHTSPHQTRSVKSAIISSKTTVLISASALCLRGTGRPFRQTHFTSHLYTQSLAEGKAEQIPPTAHQKEKESSRSGSHKRRVNGRNTDDTMKIPIQAEK